MSGTLSGIATLLIAGITNASFTMPRKSTRKWPWENTWFVWTIFAPVVLRYAAAFVTIPDLPMVYHTTGDFYPYTADTCSNSEAAVQLTNGEM